MDMKLSFTSLHVNIPSEFGMLKDLRCLGMDYTKIHDPIPENLHNMQQIKYLPIKFLQPTTQFLLFPSYFTSDGRVYRYITFDVERFHQIPLILPSIFLMKDTTHVNP